MEFANPAISRMPAEKMLRHEEAEGFVRRAFRFAALSGVMGFDPRFTCAGPFGWTHG